MLFVLLLINLANAIQPEDYVMYSGGKYDESSLKYYYLLNYCHNSQIKRKYNSTHIENKVYKDTDCKTLNYTEYIRVTYVFNIQVEIETKAYYVESYYTNIDCDDYDKTVPVYGYKVYTEKHCNWNEKGNNCYMDLGEERVYSCVGAKNHSVSTICEVGVISGDDWCETPYIGQCYRSGGSSVSWKMNINRDKFGLTNDSRDAIRFLVVFIFLFILI